MRPASKVIDWRGLVPAGLIIFATGGVLFLMHRPLICACGHVALWHGALDAGNSQHIADWYSLSHIIHGFLFYAVTRWLMPGRTLISRLTMAIMVEAGWEILENSPFIIDRYRTATIALGYSGDTIVNSMSDIAMMTLGFLGAARLPAGWIVAIGILLELLALAAIRDNLTLNVLMLTFPLDPIRAWQASP